MKLKEVKINDIPDILLKYCIRIPKEGIEIKGDFISGGEMSLPVKPIDKNDPKSGYAIKTFANPYTSKRKSCVTFITTSGETYVAKSDWIMPFLLEAGYTQGKFYDRFVPQEIPKIDNFSLGNASRRFFEEQSSLFFDGEKPFKVLREETSPEIEIIQYVEYNKDIFLPISLIEDKDASVEALGYVTPYGEILCKKKKNKVNNNHTN